MKNFTRVPNELLELTEQGKLDCYDVAVYYAIIKHKNETTGLCNPGMRRIAKLLHISKNTVQRRIRRLEKNRCIICNTPKEGVAPQYRTVVSYDIGCTTTWDTSKEGVPHENGGVPSHDHNRTTGWDKDETNNKTINKPLNNDNQKEKDKGLDILKGMINYKK